jgi:hypothetical protein
MWQNIEIDLGLITTGKSHVIHFNFVGDCNPQQVEIHASCGCNNALWNESLRVLNVTYNPSKIPPQVVGNQHIRKSIKMNYICNGNKYEDNLFFKAQLVNE